MSGKRLGPNIQRLIIYRMSKGETGRRRAIGWTYHVINAVRAFTGNQLDDDEKIASELLKHRSK